MIRNLLASLGRLTGATAPIGAAPGDAGRQTVLIIDQHSEILCAMRFALEGQTYRVETADTAESAVRKLSTFHPDLVLLDPQFPAPNGTRLARRLLADEELTAVPMVALCQTLTSGDRELGGRYDGHIRKPIDAGNFVCEVRSFLESSLRPVPHRAKGPDPFADLYVGPMKIATILLDAIGAGLPDSQFAPDTRAGLHRLAEVVEDLHFYELAGYVQQAERLTNARTVRARSRFRSVIRLCREWLAREPDLAPGVADLRQGYLDRRRAELSSLEHALKAGDFVAIRKAGHNLKGMGAAYGFAELTDIGKALVAAGRDGDAVVMENVLDQFDVYLNIVRPSPEPKEIYEAGMAGGAWTYR